MDAAGHHAVCCTKNGIVRRHSAIEDAVYQLLARSGFALRKEQGTSEGLRPGDLFVSRLDSNGPAAIDVTVRHTGYTDPDLRAKKLERDARILDAELASRPGDPFVLFNLGSIAVERQDWPRALEMLQRSLAGSSPTDSITRKLFALIARCQQMLGNLPRAIAACDEGLTFFSDDAELLFRKAVAHRSAGDSVAAETAWRRILCLRRPEEFSSVDQGIYGHLTRRNLATLAEERGDSVEAAALWRTVLDECPGDREAERAMHRRDGPIDLSVG